MQQGIRRAVRTLVVWGVVGVIGLGTAAAAAASPAPDYEMPFACGEEWTGTTRPKHSPSEDAVDFNRSGDLGKPVLASAPGIVSRVADLGSRSYGRYVIVDHANGDSTLYAHLKSTWVTEGQWVDQGVILGRVGSTGGSSGPHLHFEERLDGRVQAPWFHDAAYEMGSTLPSSNCSDIPVAGDWDADGIDEVAVFRRAKQAKFRLAQDGGRPLVVRFGRNSDQPVTGDWDGDGSTDVGLRRPGWRAFLLRNGDGSVVEVKLGRTRDVPLAGDWDGDGRTDVGVWNPATHLFTLRHSDGSIARLVLGDTDDQPVTGDWDGDGRTDIGVYDATSARFTLRSEPGDGSLSVTTLPFGTARDLPVTGDWDGNGVTDVGTWTPGTARYSLRVTPAQARAVAPVTSFRFGRAR